MDWSKTHVHSTFHICWGAQAGLYHHFGLDKILLPEKLFGVYPHRVLNRKVPLVRGFDDVFYIPHSRHTATPAEAIHSCPQLTVMAESERAGVLLCMTKEGRQIFVMGHPEYDRYTLHLEYIRDVEKGLPIHRIASSGRFPGAASFCIRWCYEQCRRAQAGLRGDTHEKNLPMQRVFQKNGFLRCGLIRVEDGTERIAFQKTYRP